MADPKKISELSSMTGTQVANAFDVLPIVDVSEDTTKKITRQQLFSDVGAADFTGDVAFNGVATFNGGTQGIDYADLAGTPPESSAGYKTRDDFIADLPNLTPVVGEILWAAGVPYKYSPGENLPSLPDFTWAVAPTLLHYGAVGDNTTDDSPAIQALVQAFSDGTTSAAIDKHARVTIDLMGRNYKMSSPVYIGRFDFNQDGTFEINIGAINGLRFANGRFTADDNATWTDAWSGQIGKYLFYVGVVVNQGYVTYSGENIFEVMNITFDNVGFDCGFKTGAVWAENTHRTFVNFCTIWDLGVDCKGVGAPQTVNSSRGYQAINQQLTVMHTRIEGILRTLGISRTPGKEDFNDGAEIALGQDTTGGVITVNGHYTTGGKFTSPTGDPYFVELQNFYDASTNYYDFSGNNFTITGFADVAETIPVSETMKGPRGGNKIRWSYSNKKYAVITSIVCDVGVSGQGNQILASTSYKAVGIDVGTHDTEVLYNNITSCSRAAIIRGRASAFVGNHPWSREVLLTDNTRKIKFSGNYCDYTDVNDYGSENRCVDNGFNVGNPELNIYARLVDDTGDGIVVTGNTFAGTATVNFVDTATTNWAVVPNYTFIGNARVDGGNSGYTFVPGFFETARAATIGGFFECKSGGKFAGNLNLQDNKLLNVATPTVGTDGVNKDYADSLGGGSETFVITTGSNATYYYLQSSTGVIDSNPFNTHGFKLTWWLKSNSAFSFSKIDTDASWPEFINKVKLVNIDGTDYPVNSMTITSSTVQINLSTWPTLSNNTQYTVIFK